MTEKTRRPLVYILIPLGFVAMVGAMLMGGWFVQENPEVVEETILEDSDA